MAVATPVSDDEPIETVAELLDRIERHPDLAIDAELTITVDEHELRILGYGELVAVDCPSLRFVGALLARYRDQTMDLAAGLASTGLTGEVRVRGVPLARLGTEANPSPLARRLGLGPIEFVPEGILLAAVTRRRE